MKSDYGRLNKTKPVSFEMVFERHAKISHAMHTLVKTAYLNHHLEEKNRRIELVKCLDGNANIILQQLGDEKFMETLKDTIQDILVKEFGVSQDTKKRLEEDIESVLNNRVKTKKSVHTQIPKNNIGKNAEYAKKITDFCINVLKTGHTKRMETLSRAFCDFSVKTTGRQTTENVHNQTKKQYGASDWLTRNLKKMKQSRSKNVLSEVVNRARERRSELLKQPKWGGSSIIRRIRKLFTVKNVLGFIGGILGGIGKIVSGMLKGIFSLTRGIVSVALGATKTVFGVATKIVTGVFRVCKKIVAFVARLNIGFLERFGKFLLSPPGMFIVGYVAGFIYQKIVGKYKEYKDKARGWWEDKKRDVHKIKMNIAGYFKKSPLLAYLRKLAIANLNMKAFKTKMFKMGIQLNSFSLAGAIGGSAGGVIGAWVGRVVGGFVGSFFGPLQPIIMGVGTALGSIAGYYIGKAYGSVPEKPASERGQKNMFIAAVTNKYKQKRERHLRGIRMDLKGKIGELDKKANNKIYDDKQRSEFAKQRDELKNRLDGISGTMTINDEEDQERERHAAIVENIQKLLTMEQGREVGQSIFKVFKDGTTKELLDFTVDSVISQAERGDISYNENGLTAVNIPQERLKAYKCLLQIKQNALNVAVDAYQKGLIPYSDIRSVANGLVLEYADKVQCKIYRNFSGNAGIGAGSYASRDISKYISSGGSVSLKDYILSGRDDFINMQTESSDDLWNLMNKTVSDRFQITDWQQDTIESLTNDFIAQYKKARGNNPVSNEHVEKFRDVIQSLFRDFIIKNNIRSYADIKNGSESYGELQRNIVALLRDTSAPEDESDTTPAIDKVLGGLFEFLKTPSGDKDVDAEIAAECSEAQKSLGLDDKKNENEDQTDPLFVSRIRNDKLRRENMSLIEKIIELGIDTSLIVQQEPDDQEMKPNDDAESDTHG